jgi:hypothetical protein
MNTLRVDDSLGFVLPHVAEPTVIVDADGTVLGQYIPDPDRVQRLYGQTDHVPSAEELDRLRQTSGPGYSLREVFEHLLPLARSPEDRADLQRRIDDLAKREG